MKTTDLRIGNFVTVDNPKYHPQLKGVLLRVIGIQENIIADKVEHCLQLEHINKKANTYYQTYSQFIEYINPIPLTEQWLLDLGFEKCTGRYGVYYKHYALEGFRVWFPHDIYGWGYTVGRKDFETGDTYWVKNEVRYVHQLQNLFFALTQEELIFK